MQQHIPNTNSSQTDADLKSAFETFNNNRIQQGHEPFSFEQYIEVVSNVAKLAQSRPSREELEAISMPDIAKLIRGNE